MCDALNGMIFSSFIEGEGTPFYWRKGQWGGSSKDVCVSERGEKGGGDERRKVEAPGHRRRARQPSRILARRIPWTEEPGGLQTLGLQSWTRLSD